MGFDDNGGNNSYVRCYSDQFSTGWLFGPKSDNADLDGCICYWYDSTPGKRHTAIRCEGRFTALVDVAKRQIAEGDVQGLLYRSLFGLYAAIPPTWHVKDEAEAKRYFLMFMKMLGALAQPEVPSLLGYADAIVETKKAVYVFEFKFNRSAKAAIRQIREKGYADAYKADKRPVTLIGINFSARKRNIDEPIIENLLK